MPDTVSPRLALRVDQSTGAGLLPCLCVAIALALPLAAAGETLTLGGNGAAAPLFALLCDAFRSQSPEVNCRLLKPPLGSSGGIRALLVGKVDMAIVARPLKAEEQAVVGKSFALADTAFVLASNGGLRRQGFSRGELAAVYSGRLASWDDGAPIRLVLRTRDDTDTLELRSMSPALSEAVALADQRPGMTFASDDLDTLALLNAVPGSLAPTTLGLLKTAAAQLTALPLDGVAPTLEHLQNGSYRWRRTLTVVLPQKVAPAAQKFADFLRSAAAAELMRRHAYLPRAP